MSDKQIQDLIQAVQSAEQSAQEAKQLVQGANQAVQEAKQTLQNAGVLSKDVTSGKANLGFEDITHDTDTDEAHRASVLSQTRMWNWNDKALIELELAKKQHDFAVQQRLDSIHVRAAEQAELVKHLVNLDYAKFNNAVSEPIAPNTQTPGNGKTPTA